MKKTTNKKFLKEAIVLLIATVMILSTVAVTADTMDKLENADSIVNLTSIQNINSGNSLFLQLPHDPDESWTMVTSDLGAGYVVYENFWDIDDIIGNIHWWGLTLKYTTGGWLAGDPNKLVFDIKFYADDPDDHTLPDELVASFTDIVPQVITGTGQYYVGFEMYYFSGADLNPFVNLSEGWVSINSKSGGEGQDWLMWASAKTGDGYSHQDGANPPGNVFDQAMNLTVGSYPPDTPATPDGPIEGVVGVEYMFSTSTTDPEGEQLSYFWDWGDGTPGEWGDPCDSGVTVYASHIWTEEGDYNITVKAKDLRGKESEWSTPKIIYIADTAVLEVGNITGSLLKVSAVIKNIGGVDATMIDWSITLDDGLIILGKETIGNILSIPAGDEVTISSSLIFGFGKTVITATAECDNGLSGTNTRNASVFLFFIF